MAIDLTVEASRHLNTQDVYDVIAFATSAAEDEGFMNSFIFERALYLFASILLYPDRKDELSSLVAQNINTAWDALLEDGTLDLMMKDYPDDLEYLAEKGMIWFEEYTAYAHSARGLLGTVERFTGDIVGNAAKQFKDAVSETEVDKVLEIADTWGMNNALTADTPKPAQELPADSLLGE